MSTFEVLNKINVNEHIEKKNGLSYLTWAWAWAEVKKAFPDAEYEVLTHDGLPYVFDENTGYMVFTKVRIKGQEHMMWLPVMDGANKAMKKESYRYIVKSYGKEVEKEVQAATMFDINKTIMRCLVKNLAMFGLGLYIYAGEDLPEDDAKDEQQKVEQIAQQTIGTAKMSSLTQFAERVGVPMEKILESYGLKSIGEMTELQYAECVRRLQKTEKEKKDARKDS